MIFTRTGSEEKLKEKINSFGTGFEAYIPLYNRLKKFDKEYEIVTRPLFPGYLFVKAEDEEALKGCLLKIADFNKLLSSGKNIVPLSAEEESIIDKLCGKEHILDISYGYKDGRDVHFTSGPLVGMENLIKKVNRHKRIAVIEIDMLNEKRELIVGAAIADKKESSTTTENNDW